MTYNKKQSYCTFSPDGLFGYYWGNHCKKHDKEYKKYKKTMTRKQADIELREGIASELPWSLKWIAWIYYFTVRVLSKPGWKRWEYNWDTWIGIFAWRKKQ